MRIHIRNIPKAILDYYKLADLIYNDHAYVVINKGMYGLPQAGRLANDLLLTFLEAAGYTQSRLVPGLFTHHTLPIAFCLVVDDFLVKYTGEDTAQHLIQSLKKHYTITIDMKASQYLGLQLDWDYPNRHVDISMPTYVAKALQRFQHQSPTKPQLSPHPCALPIYGAKTQYTTEVDTTDLLSKAEVTTLQQVIGVFLYYARAVDSTMLVALGSLAAAQSTATQHTKQLMQHFLDYAASNPQAKIRYHASDMVLHIQSDASYLSESQARSRAGGIFYLSNRVPVNEFPDPNMSINGAIHIHSTIMRNVLASAAEAEVAACFLNAQEACVIRATLAYLGHAQPPTPIQTDNQCAAGILNCTVKQKRSKAIDMRFYWLQDRIKQNQFTVNWAPGFLNMGDYFTKHHPPKHHHDIRPSYLHDPLITPIPGEGVLKLLDTG